MTEVENNTNCNTRNRLHCPDALIDAAFTPSPVLHPMGYRVRCAIISVDPAPWAADTYAMTSVAYLSNGDMLIVGVDSWASGSIDETKQRFMAHAAILKRRLVDTHVFLVICVNTGMDISQVHEGWMVDAGYAVDQFTVVHNTRSHIRGGLSFAKFRQNPHLLRSEDRSPSFSSTNADDKKCGVV
jgi:hypothetical protein